MNRSRFINDLSPKILTVIISINFIITTSIWILINNKRFDSVKIYTLLLMMIISITPLHIELWFKNRFRKQENIEEYKKFFTFSYSITLIAITRFISLMPYNTLSIQITLVIFLGFLLALYLFDTLYASVKHLEVNLKLGITEVLIYIEITLIPFTFYEPYLLLANIIPEKVNLIITLILLLLLSIIYLRLIYKYFKK